MTTEKRLLIIFGFLISPPILGMIIAEVGSIILGDKSGFGPVEGFAWGMLATFISSIIGFIFSIVLHKSSHQMAVLAWYFIPSIPFLIYITYMSFHSSY